MTPVYSVQLVVGAHPRNGVETLTAPSIRGKEIDTLDTVAITGPNALPSIKATPSGRLKGNGQHNAP